MEFTPEQYKHVSDLASINYSLVQIAMYLGVDYDAFLEEFNIPESKLRYHYDRGKLITQAELDKANLKRARDGSLSSIQQWKKDQNSQRLENFKKKVLFDKEKAEYEQLQAYVEKGEVLNLPEHLVNHFEQMDYIRALYNKYNSKSYILSMVRLKWKNISLLQASRLYNETLNFFNLDNEVKKDAWRNIYADRLDNLALICIEMNDFETARRLTMDAVEVRGLNKEDKNKVPDELLDRRPVFYTIRLKDLGLPEVNRNELAEFIDKLEITEKEKIKLRREALIEDVPFELVSDGQE